MKLSVVVPCFNEAKNVQILLDQLETVVKDFEHKLEVIVVDGASTDETPFELKKKFNHLPADSFKLILKTERGGYGKDIMEGLSHCTGDILCWTHADLQTDPKDVITAFEKYIELTKNQNKVFIKGNRLRRRPLEVFFSFGMQIISWIVLRVYISDINAQPKLFSRDFYDNHLIKSPPDDFSLDLYALYLAKTNNFKIATIPVYFKKRLHGEAKGGGGGWKMRLKLIKRTFKYIFKLKARV